MHKLSVAAIAVLTSSIALATMGPAFAEGQSAADSAAEAKIMNNAKVTVADAAKAAEMALNGKAVDVVLEATIGTLVDEVALLMPDGTEVEATVDATTGEAAKVMPSEDRNGNGGGEQNDGAEGADGESQDGGENSAN